MSDPARYYSSTAVKTTLSSSIGTTDTSISVASSSGFPSSYPYTLVIEKDTANEEIVTVTGTVGSAFAVTRGVDGTSGRSHSAGVAVEHAVIALDFTNFRSHEAAAANVHDIGSGSSVVGTATAQTISNKTLGSNLAAGGYKITGLADPTNAQDAATKNWTETGLTSQLNQATTQATNAATSATAAASSATAASASQSAAASSASAASTSASNASTSASNAASSASSAASSASTATTQASNASTSATNAASSASSASTSASTATTQASNASTSATNAASSASAAATSATSASGSASTATTKASEASTSATNAASSASAASTSATNAASSASTASTQASNASTSATNAASSATAAAGSATAAAGSASTATTQATNAAASASSASSDAISAANSAAAAAASYDSFDDRYLGSKATAPTVDNDGNALVQGALFYLNTGTSEQIGMYVYDGGSWIKASAAATVSLVTYEYTATAGQTVFSGNDNNGVSLSYTTNLVQVFLNGVLLAPGDDYAQTTNTITLVSGASSGDSVLIAAFASFNVANVYTQAQADSAFIAKSLADAKGDLIVATANDTVTRVAVGTDTYVLTADSTQAAGVKWAAASGGGAGYQDSFLLMGA